MCPRFDVTSSHPHSKAYSTAALISLLGWRAMSLPGVPLATRAYSVSTYSRLGARVRRSLCLANEWPRPGIHRWSRWILMRDIEGSMGMQVTGDGKHCRNGGRDRCKGFVYRLLA